MSWAARRMIDTYARLRMATEAMELTPSAVRLQDLSPEESARLRKLAADDFRNAINEEPET